MIPKTLNRAIPMRHRFLAQSRDVHFNGQSPLATVLALILLLGTTIGCTKSVEQIDQPEVESATDMDIDTDTGTNADTDTDTDTDTHSDKRRDTDTDTGPDTQTGTDIDSGADTEPHTNTDADTETTTTHNSDTGTDATTAHDSDTDATTAHDSDTDALCEEPIDVMQPAPDGGEEIPIGVEMCEGMSPHRYKAVACTSSALNDSDCNGFDNVECPQGQVACDSGYTDALCVMPCESDADCAPDEACLCDHAEWWDVTRCVPAECRTDADCAPYECGINWRSCPYSAHLVCRTANDECMKDSDCDGGGICRFQFNRWACVSSEDCG